VESLSKAPGSRCRSTGPPPSSAGPTTMMASARRCFARRGDAWVQQGSKLIGNDVVGLTGQGLSVALSRDGNTAIVGGHRDADFVGAAWIHNDDGWTQRGGKLVGPAVGRAYQGFSVSMSGDGNTAIVGGPSDNDLVGAAWVYIRRAGAWYLLDSKLVGAGAVGPSGQGGIRRPVSRWRYRYSGWAARPWRRRGGMGVRGHVLRARREMKERSPVQQRPMATTASSRVR
jgi:hypothetical protein